jgi:hypothetical protein
MEDSPLRRSLLRSLTAKPVKRPLRVELPEPEPEPERLCHFCRVNPVKRGKGGSGHLKRYCGHSCARYARYRGDGMFCGQCGKHYGAKQGDACFCSRECGDLWQRNKREAAEKAFRERTEWYARAESSRIRGVA